MSTSSDTYQKYYERDVSSIQSALDQYLEYKTEYHKLRTTLFDFPDEVEYDAMVPVGPLAFFPGTLIHTNEILVSLGDNWFVERSAKQAVAIAKRREEFVDDRIKESRREIAEFVKRKNLVPEIFADEKEQVEKAMFNEDGEEIVDIKEELSAEQVPAFHEQTRETSAISDDDLLALRAKEALEAKRARVIQSLSKPSPSPADTKDGKPLEAEEQRIVDLFSQFDSSDEGLGEEDSGNEQHGESDEESDAFSDEDRANAARDDDEDDYNDHVPPQRRHSRQHRGDSSDDDDTSGDIKLNVVERHLGPVVSSPPPRTDVGRKGILKNKRRIPGEAKSESTVKGLP
ncbi:hypothetical protein GGI21_003503, partial [Coemansia aciculifera]